MFRTEVAYSMNIITCAIDRAVLGAYSLDTSNLELKVMSCALGSRILLKPEGHYIIRNIKIRGIVHRVPYRKVFGPNGLDQRKALAPPCHCWT